MPGDPEAWKLKYQALLDDIKANAPTYQCMDCYQHEYYKRQPSYKTDTYLKPQYDLIEKYTNDEVCGHFNPDYWVEKGYQKNWGDADLNGHRIKINMLKRTVDGNTEYMLLIPEYLRRPAHYGNGHGDY